jgi:hypothetical protein
MKQDCIVNHPNKKKTGLFKRRRRRKKPNEKERERERERAVFEMIISI